MAENKQKQFIALPLKFVFTDMGASTLINQNVRINRLKMGDQTDNYGVFMDKITPDFLQRMILMDYISKIEVSGVEPVESRSKIIELSKLIVFSILYRNFAKVSQNQILASEPVKRWNKANPAMIIDEKTAFKEGQVQSFMERQAKEISEIKYGLLEPLFKNIETDSELQDDEKELHREILELFLSSFYPIAWFALLKFHKSNDFEVLNKIVMNCLKESLKKINIAEYCSLMIMELATNIGNLNIQKEAKLLYKTGIVNIKQIVLDPKLRLPVIESLRKKNNLLTFSWKLGGTSGAVGTKGKFQIELYDHDFHYTATKESVAQSKTADARRFDLSEFYQKLNDSGNDLDLGMFYLTFLDEACANMGIKFETMVFQSHHSGAGQTITTLTFSL
ncbi:MAG: hypothetical protein LBH07_01155 [Treponema sp.]|jgi:hypothetical protein|nr:hypothetical protein [Treponema sp.]